VELDALIALHDGALDRILRAAIAEWQDPGIEELLEDAGGDAQETAEQAWDDATGEVNAAVERIRGEAAEVVARHRGRLGQLSRQAAQATAPVRPRLRAIAHEVNAALDPYREQAAAIEAEAAAELQLLQAELDGELERYEAIEAGFVPDLPERPEAECEAGHDGLLYDSQRGWLDQLNAFRASKGWPPLTDSHEGRGIHWTDVYQSLTCGNDPDGIAQLTNPERYQVVAALVADGYPAAEIRRMLPGIQVSTVYRWAAAAKKEAQR
jgi:hypothetical protein